MKKNTFIEGTIIATLSLIFIKILGVIYVIPFYAIVPAQGTALYAYAYNIYALFLEVATAGIPNAVSKIINEFNTLNMQEAKIRTFQIGKKILGFVAIIAFIILFVFAPSIAKLIIWDLQGGNTYEDVAFVIRCVSFALLIFPFLSVTRGFFQGHRIISVSSYSQVIEQIARVIVIVGGSYLALKVFNLDLRDAVGIAVFGAFVGGLCSLIYITTKLHRHKSSFNLDKKFVKKDKITNQEIIKKIIKYAIPVIVISIAFSIYNNIDMILILRTLEFLKYPALEVETIATGVNVWAGKISIIVTSIGLGLSLSLIPTIVEAYTLKKYQEVNAKFNKALEIVLFITIPMCVGISMLSEAIWSIFYGYDIIGTKILQMAIYMPLFANLYTISNNTLQSINKFKMVYLSSLTGIILNTLLDVPFMLLLNKFGLPPYWGTTLATMIGLGSTLLIAMFVLKREYQFSYQEIGRVLKKIIIPLLAMILTVYGLKLVINLDLTNRIYAIIYVAIIALIASSIYFLLAHRLHLIQDIFGENYFQNIKNKFLPKKKV